MGCVLILVAALVPRLRDFGAGFDRGFEGQHGSFFALSAVNYERLGVGSFSGYPVQNIEALEGAEASELGTSSVALFAKHPPAVPLAAWLAAKTMGPSGWDESWMNGKPPEGLEPALRFPFLIAHLASLVLFYLAIRTAAGSRRAMIALAVLAATPVSILHATLIRAENPALAFLSAAALFHVRFLRSGRRSDLVGFGLSALFGGATAAAHWFFMPGFLLQAFLRDKTRSIALAISASTGLFVSLALHLALSRGALDRIGLSPPTLSGSLSEMFAPLLDQSLLGAPWVGAAWERSLALLSIPIFVVALLGLLLAVIIALRARDSSPSHHRSPAIGLTLPLVFGGLLLSLVAIPRSAGGGYRVDVHVPFLMYAAPGIAASVALVFDSLSGPLAKLRGGIAPLVIAVSLVAMPGLERANALRHALRDPGPRDDASLATGPGTPLPITTGGEIAALVPAGDLAIVPRALGITAAHQYYAWRTILPVDPNDAASFTHATTVIGTRRQTAWLLLPRTAEKKQSPLSAALFDRVRARHPELNPDAPDRQSETWRVWRLPSE